MYTIKLTNYAFDNTYTNARLFDTKAERDTYFNNLAGYTYNKNVNFIARDIIETGIDIKVEPSAPLFELLNYNYCIVKNDNETLYFFIRKSEQLCAGQIRCQLENDIFQNYFYDTQFSDCLIARAHIDRFVDIGNNAISFDGNVNSMLFEREDIKNVAKRLVNRQKLVMQYDTTAHSRFNDWLSENVICWVYLSASVGTYNISSGTRQYNLDYTKAVNRDTGGSTSYANGIFCYPILKEFHQLRVKTNDDKFFIIDDNFLKFFTQQNNGYANIFSIKLSIKAPFAVNVYDNYDISEDGQILTINKDGPEAVGYFDLTSNLQVVEWNGNQQVVYINYSACFALTADYGEGVRCKLSDASILPQLTFNKNEIIGADKNPIFNPKMNNSDYKELQLSFCGNNYSYDLQKLNDPNPTFEYYEMLTPDVTKGLVKYIPNNNNSVFTSAYGESYNGFAFTNDFSLPFAKGVDDQFFANNKNAYLSFQNQITKAYVDASFRGVNSLLGGALNSGGSMALGLAGIGIDFLQTGVGTLYEATQLDLTIDNMRSAPEMLQNVNGNSILNFAISPLGIYAEIYEALPNEQQIANNLSYDRGFIYNQYDNIKNHINTRRYFNYIQAIVENIIGDLSNNIKLKLREIFARGIKLWHTDNIVFNKENYERWLENG